MATVIARAVLRAPEPEPDKWQAQLPMLPGRNVVQSQCTCIEAPEVHMRTAVRFFVAYPQI
ncbi:TPA: hypothetical protein ACH3X3_004160 [Trebouxia sp. C0006]